MIVLSRKKSESIVINNDITITVVEVRGDKAAALGSSLRRSAPSTAWKSLRRSGEFCP